MLATGVGVAVVIAIVAVALVWVVMSDRLKSARTTAVLTELALVIQGSASNGRLRGTYQGYAVEAWPERADPDPNTKVGTETEWSKPVDMFKFTLHGVRGYRHWTFGRRPRLNPLAPPEITFHGVSGSFEGTAERLASRLGMPGPDAELEQRLRSLGIEETLQELGVVKSKWLPRVSFSGAAGPAASGMMGRLPGFAGFDASLGEQMADGDLLCIVEMAHRRVPDPERFGQMLGTAVRLAKINAEANALPELTERDVAQPAVNADPGELAREIVGSWTSPLLTVAFRPDGTMTAGRPGRMQHAGRWSVSHEGRLTATALGQDDTEATLDGAELTISLRGARFTFHRS